ncbi:hypothetical protein [Candidatus Berkiella aquae]|uniref:Uncharacterized protein n=1 Tax=Candidatus Berkiella aquae TaxID=295108 RepID=A0A0Q9YPF6_9GAMM|nr:hypothetical protein [Candidatus Berkiella aquae]MCS5711983.1 hypothetical protein [Candidatus Berkiella aquae]
MALSQPFLNSLKNSDEKKNAKLFNKLPFENNASIALNDEAETLLKSITLLAKKEKIAAQLQSLTLNGKPYNNVFESLVECSIAELETVVKTLETLSSSHHLRKLITQTHDLIGYFKTKYQPKGLYGCLALANDLCSSDRSIPFQYAMLTGVIMPVMSLFDDLEKDGDLTVNSISKIDIAKAKLQAALAQFKKDKDQMLQKELQEYDDKMENEIQQALKPKLAKITDLESTLQELQQKYIANNSAADQPELIQTKIEELNEEIKHLKMETLNYESTCRKLVQVRKRELIKTRSKEDAILHLFFLGINSELDFIKQRVKALYAKKEINNKYSRKTDYIKKKKELRKLKNKTGFHYLLSDIDGKTANKFITKRGGKLLYNQSQSKLAAMANSEGLCGGYSAEFLDICTAPDWNMLSFTEKMKRFKPILAVKNSFTAGHLASLSSNNLAMTLESGLRWDIQTKKDYSKNAALYEFKYDDTVDEKHQKAHKRDFFKGLVDAIINKTNNSTSARLMITFFDKKIGHVVGLNYDKDGFLFHDSNTGYIHFKDAEMFATFLVDYLCRYYPSLNNNCHLYDFDIVKKNTASYNITAKPEDADLLASTKSLRMKSRVIKQESQLLARFDSVKSSLDTLSNTLRKSISAKRNLAEQSTSISLLTPTVSFLPTAESLKQSVRPTWNQAQALQDLKIQEAAQSLIAAYKNDYDSALDLKPVLKMRVFHEIQGLLDPKSKAAHLETLIKLNEEHKLPKCEQMFKQLETLSQPTQIASLRTKIST